MTEFIKQKLRMIAMQTCIMDPQNTVCNRKKLSVIMDTL